MSLSILSSLNEDLMCQDQVSCEKKHKARYFDDIKSGSIRATNLDILVIKTEDLINEGKLIPEAVNAVLNSSIVLIDEVMSPEDLYKLMKVED